MKQEILKLVNDIKENIKKLDTEGIEHPIIDEIYESLELIEDEIYNDDDEDGYDLEEDDY